MAYFTAPAYYNIIREMPAGKCFADMVLIPRKDSGNRPAMVIELKWDKSAGVHLDKDTTPIPR